MIKYLSYKKQILTLFKLIMKPNNKYHLKIYKKIHKFSNKINKFVKFQTLLALIDVLITFKNNNNKNNKK